MSRAGEWLERLDAHVALRLLGRRMFDSCLASAARYEEAPALAPDGFVHAGIVELGANSRGVEDPLSRVTIKMRDDDRAVLGECSRCFSAYGPCRHMALLLVDLGCTRTLRRALLESGSTARATEDALVARRAAHLEASFDTTLKAWLAPARDGVPLEIAATVEDDRYDAVLDRGPSLGVSVRQAGARKLVAYSDLRELPLAARDRAVVRWLTHHISRKSYYARGIEASCALEAMREHGGVFGAGFKGLLEFRAPPVRPAIEEVRAGAEHDEASAQSLRAVWLAEGGVRIPVDEAAFFPGPFPFVWTRAGAIYRVARDVDQDIALQMVHAPLLVVPRKKLEEAGARLLRAARGRGIVVPRSESFGLPPLEEPRFVLRLAGEPLDLFGELVAVYPSGEFPLFGRNVIAAAPPRDEDTEERARAHVALAGLVQHPEDGDGIRIGAADEDAIAVWQTGLLSLRGAENPKIEVELTERLARVRIGESIKSRVTVVLEGNWLDARIDFSTREIPVELERIRDALARKKRWVSLDDGTLARITDAVESLVGEAETVMGDDAQAKLPPHQLGRLERWIEENDGRMDEDVAALRRRLRALAVAPDPEMPRALDATLRPYQRHGLAWLQFLKALGAGGVLADDMGLGKTITTLAFLQRWKEAEGAAPSLVVCPTSVATNWVHEAARFTPELRVVLLHGPRSARAAARLHDADLVVTTYGVMRRDVEMLAGTRFRCVVLDEAQYVKNADAATRRAAGALDADMRLALSGTPVENRLRELWSIATFVNPGMLGTARAFEKRYERTIAMDRKSPLADELRAVVRPFLLRRTKDDVLPELPPKTEVDRFVTLSRENKRLYDALAHTLRASVARDLQKRGGNAQLSVFTALTRLRQMACEPRLVDAQLPASASAKREAFLDLVRELVAEGRRALVFSQFVELLTLWRRDLEAEGIAYEYLDGSTTKRDVVVRRFQEGDAPLFLISLKAGGAGLNLTAADTVIHCDPWWNPAVEDQATDRAYRIGQDKPVTVVRLLAAGTIEEKILSLKAKKREIVQAVVDDSAGALAGIGEDDLRILLGDVDRGALQSDDDEDGERTSPTDAIATASRVVDPEYDELVTGVRRWLETTGGFENELATILEIPVPFVTRLAKGEPFPCSRATADRIRERLDMFRHGLI